MNQVQPKTIDEKIKEILSEVYYSGNSTPYVTDEYKAWVSEIKTLIEKEREDAVRGFVEQVDSILPELVGADVLINWGVLIDDYIKAQLTQKQSSKEEE